LFQQLANLDILKTRIGEARGEGACVAVLDTGVDVTHEAIPRGSVIRSVEVSQSGGRSRVTDIDTEGQSARQLDPVGHGTACAGIILEHAPRARIVSVRVIGANAAGTGEQFVAGLKWVLTEASPRPDVVNLSLGTTHRRFSSSLLELVEKAYYQGTILVAAGPNLGETSYPSKFASLIAVDHEAFESPFKFQYRGGQPVEFAASGIYVRAPDSGGSYRLWTGTSFACPHVTAAIARLRGLDPSLTPFEVKTLLYALAEECAPD